MAKLQGSFAVNSSKHQWIYWELWPNWGVGLACLESRSGCTWFKMFHKNSLAKRRPSQCQSLWDTFGRPGIRNIQLLSITSITCHAARNCDNAEQWKKSPYTKELTLDRKQQLRICVKVGGPLPLACKIQHLRSSQQEKFWRGAPRNCGFIKLPNSRSISYPFPGLCFSSSLLSSIYPGYAWFCVKSRHNLLSFSACPQRAWSGRHIASMFDLTSLPVHSTILSLLFLLNHNHNGNHSSNHHSSPSSSSPSKFQAWYMKAHKSTSSTFAYLPQFDQVWPPENRVPNLPLRAEKGRVQPPVEHHPPNDDKSVPGRKSWNFNDKKPFMTWKPKIDIWESQVGCLTTNGWIFHWPVDEWKELLDFACSPLSPSRRFNGDSATGIDAWNPLPNNLGMGAKTM